MTPILKKILLIIAISCSPIFTTAKHPIADSLLQLLQEHEQKDTVRVNLMQELALHYQEDSIKLMQKMASQSLKLAHQLNHTKGIIEGHLLNALYNEETDSLTKARNRFTKALELAKKTHSFQLKNRTLYSIARFHNRQNNRDSAIYYYKKNLKIASHKPQRKSEIYRQITLIYNNINDFDETIKYAQKGISLSKSINDTSKILSITNIMAATMKQQGRLDTALHYFKKTINLAKATNDKFGELPAYNNIANIYADRGNYPKALDYYFLTLKVAEDINHQRAISVTYNNIAIAYYTLEDYPATIQYLLKSLKISKAEEDFQNIANTMNNIAELYTKEDSLKKAMAYYDTAYQYIKKINARSFLTHNYRGKAKIYDKRNKPDSAVKYHQKALKIAKKVNATYQIAKSYISLAEHHLANQHYTKAIDIAQKAYDIAKKLNNIAFIRNTSNVLHQSYAELNRHKKAYQYLRQYTNMNDSMLNKDNTKELTQLEMQHKHEKEMQAREAKEAVRALKRQKEVTKQKWIRNAFIIAFVLVLLIIFQLVRYTKQKQKKNQQLSMQKAEIEEKNEELQQLMSEVSSQKDQIEENHTKITNSIKYAERIQNALFPLDESVHQYFDDYFIFYKPLEIVSGDFYWIEKVHQHLLIAVADCTGHGVPGAMMSMLGISYLNDIARQPNITEPAQVLEKLRKRIKRSLHQTGDVRGTRDGMDLAFAAIDTKTQTLTYAGANNPLFIFRNKEIIEFKADKQPISVYQNEKPFTNHSIKLQKDDVIYLFSDGYRDQFMGMSGKKFGKKQFLELLQNIHCKNMTTQKQMIAQKLDEWMQGDQNQIDDILVAGFKW